MAKAKKIITWTLASILILFLVMLGLIHFLPGYDLYLVRSESMVPAIRMGDLVVVGPVNGLLNGNIEPGRIVTYQHGQDRITHRVLSVSGGTVVMKGDALQHPDPWAVNLTDVTGVYLFKIPYVGFALNFIRTKLGWFLAIIIPTTILVSSLIWEILKETLKDEKKVSEKVQEKVGVEMNIKQKEVVSRPQTSSSTARAESNARLRKVLIETLEMQKTSSR